MDKKYCLVSVLTQRWELVTHAQESDCHHIAYGEGLMWDYVTERKLKLLATDITGMGKGRASLDDVLILNHSERKGADLKWRLLLSGITDRDAGVAENMAIGVRARMHQICQNGKR